MTSLDTLINSSLATVTRTDFQPFTDPDTGLQRRVLSIRNLTKAYHARHKVLDGISFDLHVGEVVGVTSHSGADKSTLLHVLSGTHNVSGGEILSCPEVGVPHGVSKLRGCSLNAWRSQCGTIFQDFCLVPRLDVLTNILLGRLSQTSTLRSLSRIFPETDRAHAITLFEWMNMLPYALQWTENFSGGQVQRVAIYQALIQNSGVLLADEPVASLDSKNTQRTIDVLREISEQGINVMVNLHSVGLVKAYCARVTGIASGQLISDDHPSRLAQNILQQLYGDEVSQLH